MKIIAHLVNGKEITIEGPIAKDVSDYFTKKNGTYETLPIGWVATKDSAINFHHVTHIEVKEAE